MFLQAGLDGDRADAVVAGAIWDLPWRKHLSFGTLASYLELSVGRWSTDAGRGGSAWVAQLGVTPVVRLRPTAAPSWFLEAAVGAHLILPVYRSSSKQFSTAFNFGEHIALGRSIGDHGRQEVALRLQHFSNGGIEEPNPGMNFVQLRYTVRF